MRAGSSSQMLKGRLFGKLDRLAEIKPLRYIALPERISDLTRIEKLVAIGDPAVLDSAQFTLELIPDGGKVAIIDL